jgi:hypothetical protein
MIKNKKGIQLNEAFGAILTIILVALLVIVSIVIFTSMNSATIALSTAGSSANESLLIPTTSGITLAVGAGQRAGSCGAVTQILNGTTGNVNLGLGNITQVGCVIKNATDWTLYTDETNARFSYPYTYSAETSASNASNSMTSNFSQYPALVGLVGTIIFLALVIGVLVASFAFGRKPGV